MPQDQGLETDQSVPQEPPKINRRRLLGNTAKAIAGTAVGIPLAREVKQTVEQKVETTEGVFYPLYEFHYSPIEKLPDKVDIYWREGPGDMLAETVFFDPNGLIRKSLYEKGARVAVGDVDYRPQDLSKDEVTAIADVIAASAIPIAAAASGLWVGNTFLVEDPLMKKINRRVILGAAVAGYFSTFTQSGREQEEGILQNKQQIPRHARLTDILDEKNPSKDLIGKATIRLEGLLSDFHPELAITFFRNAVWAHKLLEYSKRLQKDLGRKPNFALAIGAGHGGVEDFLILGEKFIETCISAYPKEWLSEVMKTNGGLQEFSTMRITQPTHSPTETPDLKSAETFIDQSLMGALTKKLS